MRCPSVQSRAARPAEIGIGLCEYRKRPSQQTQYGLDQQQTEGEACEHQGDVLAHVAGILFQVAKGQRIPKLLGGWNAVLPLRARRSLEQIGRARFEADRRPLPARSLSATQPESADGQK